MKYLDLKQLQGSFNALNKSIKRLPQIMSKFLTDVAGSLGLVSAINRESGKVKGSSNSIEDVSFRNIFFKYG